MDNVVRLRVLHVAALRQRGKQGLDIEALRVQAAHAGRGDLLVAIGVSEPLDLVAAGRAAWTTAELDKQKSLPE